MTVDVFVHQKSGDIVLLPLVWHRAGHSVAFGDGAALASGGRRDLGKTLTRLFDELARADVDALDAEFQRALRAYHLGETTSIEPTFGPTCRRVIEKYPVLTQGPGRFLISFRVASLLERPGVSSRRLTRQIRSPYRGAVTDGESIRLARTLAPDALGDAVLRFVEGEPSR